MNNSETISNIGKAHYLANLPNNYYKNNIFESDAIVEEGEKYDTETYLTQLKNWLQLVIQNKGNMKTKYNYSKNMKDCGRLYVQTFGIQKLERKIRGFLCNEDYIDIDMVNAHPTILLYIQQTYFKQLESPTLTKYVKSRSKYLTKYNFTKKDFLINMNKSDNYTGNNSFIKTAHQEIQKLQQAIFQSTEPIFCNVSKAKLTTTNTTARFLNRVLCYFENIILQEAVSTFDKSKLVYFFDGFFLSKKDVNSLPDIIEKLNKNKYNIQWSNKEHDTTIQIDPDYELPIYETPYDTMKIDFEKQHFMTENPLCYYKHHNGILMRYNKSEFKDLTENLQYEGFSDSGKPIKKNFFLEWLKDINRLCYNRTDFYPNNSICPSNVYNTFTGFDSKYILPSSRVSIDNFKIFISNICMNEENVTTYLTNYLAHMIQKPEENPEVCLIIRGSKGVGKDTIRIIMSKMLGNKYVYDTDTLEDVVGKYNEGISNKLLIQMNEMEGQDGYKFDNKLKNFITEKKHNIANKNIKQYQENNYNRLIIFSNGIKVANITGDNRRYCLIKTGEKLTKEFYEQLYSNMADTNYINSIYSYLCDIDLSNFKTRQFPETEVLKNLKEENVNPLYKFIHQLVIEKSINCTDMKKDAAGCEYLLTRDFINYYSNFLESEGYSQDYINKYNFKNLKIYLQDIGIDNIRKRFDNKQEKFYKFNLTKFQELLAIKYSPTVKEEIDNTHFV